MDNLRIGAPSASPPGGLEPGKVPQMIAFGFDDDSMSGRDATGRPHGVAWVVEAFSSRRNPPGSGNAGTFDGSPCSATFFVNSRHAPLRGDGGTVGADWKRASDLGFEIANHTASHPHGGAMDERDWAAEIEACTESLARLGIPEPSGFRAPYLEYSDGAFAAAARLGFAYDSSVEEGWEDSQDGSTLVWPYDLGRGSPGNALLASRGVVPAMTPRPGLAELPLHAMVAPDDADCPRFGIDPGLRDRLARRRPHFDRDGGRITGLDWNLLVDFRMTKAEFLGTLRLSLERRMSGNRCPLVFGAHADIYSPGYEGDLATTWRERQEAVEEFLDWALGFGCVRVVRCRDALAWARNPVPLP